MTDEEKAEATRIADRYRRVTAQFTDVVEAVPADGWSNPSPCEGWDARAIVDHLVGMWSFLLGLIDRELPADAPTVADDPPGAWLTARDTVQAILDDPDAATQVHKEHRHLGQGPWNRAVDMVLTSDAVIHAWDLGQAIGREVLIAPEDLAGWEDAFGSMPEEAIRQPEVFGPALQPPPDADEQTRFLAFLGRKSW